jgi:ADP-heptose:LPS heptosyltransferase
LPLKPKILVIRFSSIGDIVLTSPVVRCLKVQLNDAEIHFCTKIQYKKLVENNPYIDKVYYLENSLWGLISKLKTEKYDYVIDLHNNLRSTVLKTLLGVKTYSFQKLNFEKWLYVKFKINKLPNKHIVERYLETILPLGVKNDELGLDFFISDSDTMAQEDLPAPFNQLNYVAFAIGGQHATKKLPLKKMIELCDRINKPVILLGGKDDFEIGQQLVDFFEKNESNIPYEQGLKELGKKTILLNLCGKTNIGQSASIIKKASYVFTHDTGLMHIAAAFKKEIFSIWGSTTPFLGMYPYRTKFTVFENNTLDCRPCSKIGFDKCPKGHFKCMNNQNFDFYLP